MTENISMTRIIDLPESQTINHSQMASDMYMPMNVHPNPYGIKAPPPGGMPNPIHVSQEENKFIPSEHIQRLPQRDIPMNNEQYNHDEQVQPNYVPKIKLTSDYIEEYQKETDYKIREYENNKKKEKKIESWFDELHTPIVISLLYFIFSLPIINTTIFKRFSFLSIYKEDGNFNIIGLTLKCILFGISFYGVHKSMNILSEM